MKGTKSQVRQRPGKVTPESHVKKPVLKVDFVLGLRQARLCTVQLTDAEPIWLRDPQPGNPRRPRKGLILSGAYTTDNTPENVLRGIATLIDSGAMYWPLRGGKMFHAIHYTKAEFPIRLVGAGKNRLAGGSQVVKCSVTLPVWHDGRYVTVKCVQVTVHLAFVGPRVILGYQQHLNEEQTPREHSIKTINTTYNCEHEREKTSMKTRQFKQCTSKYKIEQRRHNKIEQLLLDCFFVILMVDCPVSLRFVFVTLLLFLCCTCHLCLLLFCLVDLFFFFCACCVFLMYFALCV